MGGRLKLGSNRHQKVLKEELSTGYTFKKFQVVIINYHSHTDDGGFALCLVMHCLGCALSILFRVDVVQEK